MMRQPRMMNETTTPTNADKMTPAATPWTKISFLFIADFYALGRSFFAARVHEVPILVKADATKQVKAPSANPGSERRNGRSI